MLEYALQLQGITKTFHSVKALDNITLDVKQGEIMALVGENGAGKSTLMKILNGNYQPDSGTIRVFGELISENSPKCAKEHGISIIFQEIDIIPTLSVAENLFLGEMLEEGQKLVHWSNIYKKARTQLKKMNLKLDVKQLAGNLSVAQQQLLAISKSIYSNAKIILMDEPSASLTNKELEQLFKTIRDLKEQGVTVIYISHRLEEIFDICDRVTVLRDGKLIDTKELSETNRDEIVQKMIGRTLDNNFPVREHNIGKEIFRVENFRQGKTFQDISFSLHAGEVLGMYGLVGAGRTEIARAIFGIDYSDSGTVKVSGEPIKIKTPADSKTNKIAFLTEDRKTEGLICKMTVAENITMNSIDSIVKGKLLDINKEKQICAQYIESLSIKTPSPKEVVNNLSGGNQQKIVVAKWLNCDVDIYIFDEPTRGIDVGAKYEIYTLINQIVSEGKGVIFISSELPEVLGMSDRILIIKNGKISAELTGEDINSETVMQNAI